MSSVIVLVVWLMIFW